MSTLVYHGPARRLPVLSVRWLGERPRGDCATRAPKILEAGYRAGVKPGNAGRRFPPEPLTTDEVLRLIAACPNGAQHSRMLRLREGGTSKHHDRVFIRRSGSQGRWMTRTITPWQTRFWRYVNPTADGCWEWTGARTEHGYGRLGSGGHSGRTLKAHRCSYEIHLGPIPDGMLVCHRCDNPPCVNPAHLFLGTRADNSRDMAAKGRGFIAHGEQHPAAKYSDALIREIRYRAAAGESRASIARRFGLRAGHVSHIVLGDRRPEAGGPIQKRAA